MLFSELAIGQSYVMERSFAQDEIRTFASLSFDTNPLHIDPEYAKRSQFGQLIVPGFLTASLFSAIIGTKFPGEGSIYLNQNLNFRRPVFPNQLVKATVEVLELFPEKHRVLLNTTCSDTLGNILIDGTALVKLP